MNERTNGPTVDLPGFLALEDAYRRQLQTHYSSNSSQCVNCSCCINNVCSNDSDCRNSNVTLIVGVTLGVFIAIFVLVYCLYKRYKNIQYLKQLKQREEEVNKQLKIVIDNNQPMILSAVATVDHSYNIPRQQQQLQKFSLFDENFMPQKTTNQK